MSHPDFRVGGKIFATLAYPDPTWAMVKLTPAQQVDFVAAQPEVFTPVKGLWGARGATRVRLAKARVGVMRLAVQAAWEGVAKKHPGTRQANDRR